MHVAAIAAAAIDRDHISRVDAARSFCRENTRCILGVARGDTIVPARRQGGQRLTRSRGEATNVVSTFR
jgi:hypothetical protein